MNENKDYKTTGLFLILLALLTLGVLISAFKTYGLAGVSVGDYIIANGTTPMPAIVENTEIVWTQEMENKRLEALKPKKVENVPPKVEKSVLAPKEVKIDTSFDINKLAKAVAIAETGNCTKGYGKEYNNCFGIRNGNTAPCPKIGRSRMCIYEKPEDSYEAFKTIWAKWYKGHPNLTSARRWTGNDNAVRWLSHVNLYYNKL